MKHAFCIFAVVAASLSGGCGSFVPVVKMDKVSPEERQAAQAMQIYLEPQLVGKNFRVVGVVEGNSCKNKMWDASSTRTAAIEQLKYFAMKAGANGITNIECGQREETSLNTNCWELLSCTANAIQISP